MLTYGKRTLAAVVKPWGQSAVTPPFLGGGTVARWDGRGQESTFQVLLEQLAGDTGLSSRDQVQVRRVAILLHPIGGQRPRLSAQTLADHPALHARMETILEKNLMEERGSQQRKSCSTCHSKSFSDLLFESSHSHVRKDFNRDAGRRGDVLHHNT